MLNPHIDRHPADKQLLELMFKKKSVENAKAVPPSISRRITHGKNLLVFLS